jgi:hypothetical protein
MIHFGFHGHGLLVTLLMSLAASILMIWIDKSRTRNRPGHERNKLRHPSSTLIIGIVMVTFSFGVAILANTEDKTGSMPIGVTLFLVAFGLAFVPLIMSYFFATHQVSERGMDYGRMFGQRGKFKWSELRKVSYNSSTKWFVLEATSGEKVRVSAMHLGLPDFARLILLHVPRKAIDPRTLALLMETEQGNPPSLWT